MPVFSPFITKGECIPCKDASRCTSRHHEYAISIINVIVSIAALFVILFIIMIMANIIEKIPFDVKIGQGLCSTKWNGLNLFIITVILFLLCIWLLVL